MKMLAAYLEKATDFERMAAEETNAEHKATLLAMTAVYRKLADERAARLNSKKSSSQSN